MNAKLKNRCIYSVIMLLVCIPFLLWKPIVLPFLCMIYTIGFVELKSVMSKKVKSHLGVLALAFLFSLYMIPALFSAYCIRLFFVQGSLVLLVIVALTFLCDTTAYFVGNKWGKTKLLPKISPNKTWEGAVAGIWAATIGAMFLPLLGFPFPTLKLMGLGVFIGILAVVGDLLESGFKRLFGVKDTSKLFGEHGGLLDRIDSHLLTLPWGFIFFLFYSILYSYIYIYMR